MSHIVLYLIIIAVMVVTAVALIPEETRTALRDHLARMWWITGYANTLRAIVAEFVRIIVEAPRQSEIIHTLMKEPERLMAEWRKEFPPGPKIDAVLKSFARGVSTSLLFRLLERQDLMQFLLAWMHYAKCRIYFFEQSLADALQAVEQLAAAEAKRARLRRTIRQLSARQWGMIFSAACLATLAACVSAGEAVLVATNIMARYTDPDLYVRLLAWLTAIALVTALN